MSSILSSTTSAMRSTASTTSQLLRASTAAASSSSNTPSSTSTRRTVSTRSRTPHDPNSTASARIYTPRKEFLFQTYQHLLGTSQAVIVFQPNNLSSAELAKIRRAIKGVPVTKGMLEDVQGLVEESSSSEASPPPPTEEFLEPIKATFTIARTGLLSAVVRSGNTPTASLSPLLSGPVALLTTPSLSPPYLKSLFAAMNKSLGYRPPPPTSANLTITPTSPRLVLLGALLEGNKVLSASELTSLVASTPELSTLRAQLVGLLEMPGRSLLGVTQMAGGGGLVRTLMGLEAGLKEGQEKEGGEVKPE